MREWRNAMFLTLAMMLLLTQSIAGDKPQLHWFTFNEGLAEAKTSGKKIMIDVFTDWCGWCKKMDKDTYADSSVVDYLNKRYIAIRLDAESGRKLQYQGETYTERELATAFGVRGYPSVIFLSEKGEGITVYPGYIDASGFKVVLSYVAEDNYKTTKFEEYVQSKQ